MSWGDGIKARKSDSPLDLENIEKVLRSGRQLLRLINDSLEIARYGSGTMKVQPVLMEIRTLIHPVLEMVEPLAKAKNLQLRVNLEKAPNQVETDPLRFQQILTNLMSNAIRYSEQGLIQVHGQLEKETHWSIAIADNGIGISPDQQAHLFEPFFQAKSPHSPEGTGLGLTIVAQLVELLQGQIYLASQVGLGSTFKVIFPVKLIPPSPD